MRVELRDLVLDFPGGGRGLDRAGLSLETPCFVVLAGPNGGGKTLLARSLLGLERPDSGEVLVDGVPLARLGPGAGGRIGLVFQEPEHQILGVTVAEDAEFAPRARGLPAPEYRRRGEEALALAGLGGFGERLTAFLSGGEKRRLAVAGAWADGPELLVLDEPFNDLDWAGADALLRVLLDLRSRGAGILVVTHDLEKCLAHAERLVVMGGGRILRDGTPAALWDELPELGLRRPAGGRELLAGMTWLKPGAAP